MAFPGELIGRMTNDPWKSSTIEECLYNARKWLRATSEIETKPIIIVGSNEAKRLEKLGYTIIQWEDRN